MGSEMGLRDSPIAGMEKGLITETGSHDELVSQEGLYARLWAVQTGEASE